jgi:hypothetical protein
MFDWLFTASDQGFALALFLAAKITFRFWRWSICDGDDFCRHYNLQETNSAHTTPKAHPTTAETAISRSAVLRYPLGLR